MFSLLRRWTRPDSPPAPRLRDHALPDSNKVESHTEISVIVDLDGLETEITPDYADEGISEGWLELSGWMHPDRNVTVLQYRHIGNA